VQPTRPPDDRRARHEATGEWPQPTLSAMLDARLSADAERIFMLEGLREGGRQFTFGDLRRRADRIAVGLRTLGVRAGDVVSWQLPNWFEGAALAVAIDRLGAVSNPIITIYREREVTFVCRQARSRVLVVPGEVRGVDHRELARAVQAGAPDLEHVVTVRAAPAAGQRALETLEDDPSAPLPPSPLGPHDVCGLFYTSGTTADPKGVLHTPSTIGAILHYHAEIFPPQPDDRSLLQFPITHIGGLVMFVWMPIRWGSSVVYMETFDPPLALDLVERHRVTSAGGPPAILQSMFAAPNFAREKLRTVRMSGSGAADVSPELMHELQEKFDCFAFRSYGMTECPMFTCGRHGDPEAKLHGTDGRRCRVRSRVWSTNRDGRCRPASRARSRRTARSSASAISIRRSTSRSPPTASSAPATSPSPTPRASSVSPAGARTSSSARAKTSPPRASRTTSPPTRASPTWR
jgi:cyclohexanecarboxylate-CoA ligase